jgi:hypothetical protein
MTRDNLGLNICSIWGNGMCDCAEKPKNLILQLPVWIREGSYVGNPLPFSVSWRMVPYLQR